MYPGRPQHTSQNAAHILTIPETPGADQVRIPGDKTFHTLFESDIFDVLLYPSIDIPRFFLVRMRIPAKGIHQLPKSLADGFIDIL
jgi:hypothetical protein